MSTRSCQTSNWHPAGWYPHRQKHRYARQDNVVRWWWTDMETVKARERISWSNHCLKQSFSYIMAYQLYVGEKFKVLQVANSFDRSLIIIRAHLEFRPMSSRSWQPRYTTLCNTLEPLRHWHRRMLVALWPDIFFKLGSRIHKLIKIEMGKFFSKMKSSVFYLTINIH